MKEIQYHNKEPERQMAPADNLKNNRQMSCIFAVQIHKIALRLCTRINNPHPRALLPQSIYHLHRSGPANDAFPALDVFVVSLKRRR